MEKTKVLLNDVAFLRTIGKSKLKVSIYLGYAWPCGIVEIRRENVLWRDDFFSVLESGEIRKNFRYDKELMSPSQAEMKWLKSVKKLYDAKLNITFGLRYLFPD